MIYKAIMLLVVLSLACPQALAEEPVKPPPAKMIGAAPVPDLLGPPALPKREVEGEGAAGKQEPMIAPTAPVPITPGDYELYLKSGDRSKEWDDWIKPAFESFDSGNYATAAIFLSRAYEKGCRDPMVLFRLGIYEESKGRAKEAAEMLKIAAAGAKKRYPKHQLASAIHRHAGRALYKVDDYKGALPHLKEALTFEPNDFMLLLMTGQIERMEGRKEKARGYFELALGAPMPANVKPDPKTTVLGELIVITYDLKDYDACDKYIKMALERDPKDKVANKYKGLVGRARFRQRELEIIKKIVE
jgi:tetratricopeptide (TPR) repeat protein